MNEDYSTILDRLTRIENEVNKNASMLESIQRRARIAILFSFVKWFVIIGFSLGIFYYSKPYLENTMNMYTSVMNLTGGQKNASSTSSILEEFKMFLK
jgi:cell division septal protein FtsQ